jgi:hypothetical protein
MSSWPAGGLSNKPPYNNCQGGHDISAQVPTVEARRLWVNGILIAATWFCASYQLKMRNFVGKIYTFSKITKTMFVTLCFPSEIFIGTKNALAITVSPKPPGIKMIKSIRAFVAVCALGIATIASATPTYTYTGSWIVGEGPVWTSNPQVYSGQSAAALLFGGNASDYVISTVDNTVANINFLAFLDGWGDTQYLNSPAAMDYSLSSIGGGYNEYPAFSAYVLDHTCMNRYSDINAACSDGTQYVNYAFKVSNSDVPEPTTLALFGLAFASLAVARRRKI